MLRIFWPIPSEVYGSGLWMHSVVLQSKGDFMEGHAAYQLVWHFVHHGHIKHQVLSPIVELPYYLKDVMLSVKAGFQKIECTRSLPSS